LKELTICEFNQMDKLIDRIRNISSSPDENIKAQTGDICYLSSAAAVVFGGHLSARAAFRLDRKSPAVRTCVWLPTI
jgi:hypothetical protein